MMNEPILELDAKERALAAQFRLRGVVVDACYQCLRCSAGCPMAAFMDIAPNRIVRMIQVGLDGEALASKTPWMCASCQTCTTRCPNEVDIAHLMDLLRQEALRRNIPCPEKDVYLFHRAFLKEAARGRVHELSLIGRYKMSTGRFGDDMRLGWEMFRRGRIKLWPSRLTRSPAMKRLFKEAENGE